MSADVETLVARVLAGDERAIARTMRIIDDRDPRFLEILKSLYPHTGRSYILGVTGTPGAGKSTLVDRLIEGHRAAGRKVGVVAVDPTSPYSGGAILGDRIRMQRHFTDDQVFIRSLATRGQLGGLSQSAGDVTRVLDAAGFETVILETVGVGQDELEVARLADTTIVVLAPGLGDDIQAIKAGILEVADVFAVNKADREGADATVCDIEQMIAIGGELAGRPAPRGHSAARAHRGGVSGGARDGRWVPPVLKTIATRGEGIAALMEASEQHRTFLAGSEAGAKLKAARLGHELGGVFREALVAEATRRLGDRLASERSRVEARATDPYTAAEGLLAALFGEGEGP